MTDPDLDLLAAQTRVLWGVDAWGRRREPPLAVVAIAAAGHDVLLRPDLDDDLAGSLTHILGYWAATVPPADLRPALESSLPLLIPSGITATVRGGPSFLVTATASPPSLTGHALAYSSEPADVRRVADLTAPDWDSATWTALLTGTLGPWAMLTGDDEVVSVCHTTRETPAGAVAAPWTAPRRRGHGYAALATAAWAGLLRERDARPLFYRAADTDLAAQRVAARLALHPLGWLWSIREL